MAYITVFGDIHGNLPALEAVLSDLDARGLRNRYCLGDLVGYGTSPNEIIAIIRNLVIPTIYGNYDEGVGNNSKDCGCAYRSEIARELGNLSIAWTNKNTSEENKAYLRSLPFSIPVVVGGVRFLLVHGSPRKVNEYLFADRPERSLERLFNEGNYDVLVCGHTHLPYHRVLASGKQVINAGSVGKPKDGDNRAGYVVIKVDDKKVSVDFVRLDYDIERAANAIESSDMPDEFAAMLRLGEG
jgi:putative phosphoesterase